jgi:1-phosphofructokinase family hexose kinase
LIVTLTVNPAIDRNVLTDRLVFDDRSYILSTREQAGGRGINASSVLHSFGAKTLAIATAGGETGSRFKSLLGQYSYPVHFVPIKNDIRINLTVTDKHGLSIKLNEAGPLVSADELDKVEATVKSRLPKASWLMLMGSLPPGAPAAFYSRLIQLAASMGVETLLDTDGEPLRASIEHGPTVATPNQQEAERLLNRALLTRGHFLEAAEQVSQMGAKSVILSLGARGAVAMAEGHMWEVIPPRVDVLSPIGAGDAMGAAFVWARKKKKEFPDAVRWGVAAGTASAQLPGVSFADLEKTKEIYRQVEVRPVR